MHMEDCPKYKGCSAPICPLDPNWRKARHLRGERICFYLCEAQKDGAEAIFRGRGLGELFKLMVEAAPDISVRWRTIKNALTKAAKTGSRMNRKLLSSNTSGGRGHAKS
jgi:hypothetical protein